LGPPEKGAWSNGVVEYWSEIEERVLKTRKLVPTQFPMDRAWIDISALMVFNTPIIQYSITPCERKNHDRQSWQLRPHPEGVVF
jgi:hypothetical protein